MGTSYDTACQTAPGFVEPCLEKGDLLFIIDSNYLVDAYDAYESTTNALVTIEKIYTADPTEDTFGWGAPGTFGEDRFRIVLDKNVNFAGPATTGNYQSVSQCSNRGACDTDAGNCECFKGYTGDDCTTQSSLAVRSESDQGLRGWNAPRSRLIGSSPAASPPKKRVPCVPLAPLLPPFPPFAFRHKPAQPAQHNTKILVDLALMDA